MISAKKLVKMAKKWEIIAAIQRKGVSSPRNCNDNGSDSCCSSSSSVVEKGHFVVYTADQGRFVVPLAYLNNSVFRQLLKMSEEEYGLPSDGPIVLPCDSVFMDWVICSIRHDRAAGDLQELLNSVANSCCTPSSSCSYEEQSTHRQLLAY